MKTEMDFIFLITQYNDAMIFSSENNKLLFRETSDLVITAIKELYLFT